MIGTLAVDATCAVAFSVGAAWLVCLVIVVVQLVRR